MKQTLLVLVLVLFSALNLRAQEATETADRTPSFAFEFPIDAPTNSQIDDAYDCVLSAPPADTAESEATPEADSAATSSACTLAQELVASAQARGGSPPSQDEIDQFSSLIEQNPALALHLDLLAGYYAQVALVAPPDFADQPITDVTLHYKFAGLGDSVGYDLTITDAETTPQVSGEKNTLASMLSAPNADQSEGSKPPLVTPEVVSGTVDPEVIQALAPALSDLVPIGQQFSLVPCWDYYPDWEVTLTFADGTEITMLTNQSNVVGVGGPWQVEIDGRHYMQYSAAFPQAVVALLDALELPLGTTAAMGCGDIDDPLHLAYPRAA